MKQDDRLIGPHGGYRELKSFQIAQLVYDLTVRFFNKYISIRSRTHDQMVQAVRSGVQNIAEGSQAAGTSKKTELKLTNIARASLEELKLDYEDFLRQRNLQLWKRENSLRQELVDRRLSSVKEIVLWIEDIHKREKNGRSRQSRYSGHLKENTKSTLSTTYQELAANTILTFITVACYLLDKQLAFQESSFKKKGEFNEQLYNYRKEHRQ